MKDLFCYFCGKPKTSREHVPPKLMFKNFKCDSITVPSCDEHNCEKGGKDQQIVTAFLMPYKNELKQNKKLRPDIEKAVKSSMSSFKRTKNHVFSKYFFDLSINADRTAPEIGRIDSTSTIKNWIKNLSAGIVYDALKYFDKNSNWSEIETWSPDYYPEKYNFTDTDKFNSMTLNNDLRIWMEKENWISGWSAHPNKYPKTIYHFFFAINDEEIIFKHIFYENYTWFVWVKKFGNLEEMLLKKSA